MEYSDAALRRLRDRLVRYRSDHRLNGQKRAWKVVAGDIYDAPSTPGAFKKSAPLFTVWGEGLRRFAAGTQTLSPDRLDVLRDFLFGLGYLKETDLTDTIFSLEEARGLYAFFDPFLSVYAAPAIFEGHYVALSKTGGGCEISMLRIAQHGDVGLHIEEDVHVAGALPTTTDERALTQFLNVWKRATFRRQGWLIALMNGQVLVTLQDPLNSAITFSSIVHWKGGSEAAGRTPYLVELKQPALHAFFSRELSEALNPKDLGAAMTAWIDKGTVYYERQDLS